MAPKRTSKRKSSSESSKSDAQDQLAKFPAPPQLVPVATGSPRGSPRISPSKRRNGITQHQRQFLIDNLQAEITNRARELRAEANTRAQRLRSNIELKIYRIPAAIRKATLSEVLLKYKEQSEAPAASPKKTQTITTTVTVPIPKARTGKRNSTYILEDEPESSSAETAANKKPRLEGAKAATGAAAKRLADARILSPRSHNSRMLPQSPVKGATSPLKSAIGRPASPVKSAPPTATQATSTASTAAKPTAKPKARPAPRAKAAASKTATASTASMRAKRVPASKADDSDGRRHSNESSATTNSTGTTIVTKKRAGTVRAANKAAADGKLVGIPAAGKRVRAAPAAAATAASAAKTAGSVRGGRTLRTRA